MATGFRKALSAAGAAGFLALQSVAAGAATTSCTGSSSASSATQVLFDLSSATCSISSADVFLGEKNQFAFFAVPFSGPDYYWSVKDDDGDSAPADSMTVNGVAGTTDGGFFNELAANFSGSVVAVILAELLGQTYEMTVNLNIESDRSIAVSSASVTSPSPVPLPAAFPLLAASLAFLGLSGLRAARISRE